MRKFVGRLFTALLVFIGVAVIFNLSWLAPTTSGNIKILAHRGVHQTFYRKGLTNETCTAERIYEPTHRYLENTISSMRAAVGYGADMIEIDILPTMDKQFAVFHDWTVDCRTNGTGRTIDHSLAELQALDIGYGYTANNGKTYPLRGTGVGLIPSLSEVLTAFPGLDFMINLKSNRASDADDLMTYLEQNSHAFTGDTIIWAGPKVAHRWRNLNGLANITTRQETKKCAQNYILLGWSGHVPHECAGFGLVVPENLSWLYWGWPQRTLTRFEQADMRVFINGALSGPHEGIDTLEQLADIPTNYNGWVITNRIEVIGPALKGANH